MTRIIAGVWGGRQIRTPKGDGTRPTSDRVREALFSSLESELGGFAGLTVLDLFAGSGALGLEALSRGAAAATFVEANGKAAAVITANARDLGTDATQVVRGTAASFVLTHGDVPFDLIFLDPPYALPTDEVGALVRALKAGGSRDALIVVERSTRDPFTWPDGVEAVREKTYGETSLWYGR